MQEFVRNLDHNHFQIEHDELLDANKLINKLDVIFPHQIVVDQLLDQLYQRKFSEALRRDVYTAEYLPFHTRDNAWLAKYVRAVINQDPTCDAVYDGSITEFVETSPFFARKRDAYEQNLVRAQMTRELKNGAQADANFYHGVTHACRIFGLDRRTVESNLEQNRALFNQPEKEL